MALPPKNGGNFVGVTNCSIGCMENNLIFLMINIIEWDGHCDIYIYTGENIFVLRCLTNFLLFSLSSYLKMETGYINRYDTLSQHTFKMRACDYHARISRSINSIWAIQSPPWKVSLSLSVTLLPLGSPTSRCFLGRPIHQTMSSWWFQPIRKILVKLEVFSK